MSYLIDSHDVIFLPFNSYTGEDLCGNSWNVYGLTIGTSHAKEGKAAQLNFGPNMSIYQNQGVNLGGQDFTIDMWVYVDSSTNDWGRILELNNGTNSQRIELARSGSSNNLYVWSEFSNANFTISNAIGTLFHFAFVYEHSKSKATVYKNGVSCGSNTYSLSRTFFPNLNLGYSYYDGACKSKASVDCFRVADGLARWTSNFTPPSTYQVDDVDLLVDTSRQITANQSISVDTLRAIEQSGEPESITVDTKRKVVEPQSISADTLRIIEDGVEITLSVDTNRQVVNGETVSADTCRVVQTSLILPVDTSRQIMHTVDPVSGTVQSIEINLSPQQVTDKVTLVANNDYDIMEYVQGSYLDYDFKLRVESTSRKGIIQHCQCTNDIDSILYNGFTYRVTGRQYAENEKAMAHAATHLSAIASGLGLTLVSRFDDYVSTMDCEQFDTCYKDLISNLFGWSSRVPQMMINPYIRGDCLYVIQRGHEANVIDISNLKRTMPTINKEITRTMWGTATTVTEVKRTPGVWWTRLVEPLQDTDDTHYDYFLGLLRHKITNNADGSTTTTSYEYGQSYANNKKYLTKETEVTTKGDKVLSERITEHIPLLNGQMETRTYVDGELEGSTVSKGSSNDIPSDFIVKQETVTLVEPTEESQTLPAHSLVDTSFPINNSSMLTTVTNAIKWLNRKTKETVTMDIYDYDHIIDFNDRVLFNGNTYFVESNVAQKTPRINNQQSLTLVRWY